MGKKFIYFNGLKYTRDEKTGYYLNSTNSVRLHRSIWEYHNEDIPKGFHVHHIDGDKSNNNIENLAVMDGKEHLYLHGKQPEGIEKIQRAQPLGQEKAKEWHRSEEGSKWHKSQYLKTKDKLHEKKDFKCERCGTKFEAVKNGLNRFCSNKCKAAARRDSGIDNVTKDCEFCGTPFTSNKYQKKRFCSKACSNKGVVRLPQLKNNDTL